MGELLRETTDLSSHNRDAPEEELITAAIDTYDAVVLGSGEAGKSIAWHLGGTGKRVVVVEQRYVGGSCPNIACLPSKNLVHGASIAHTVAASEALGTRVASGVSMREIQARKRTMVEGLIQNASE
jgi:pyruvate/2-oxoglutarate dehydrogenase complex dihydrolipoamide dehydrogenase (E3) component